MLSRRAQTQKKTGSLRSGSDVKYRLWNYPSRYNQRLTNSDLGGRQSIPLGDVMNGLARIHGVLLVVSGDLPKRITAVYGNYNLLASSRRNLFRGCECMEKRETAKQNQECEQKENASCKLPIPSRGSTLHDSTSRLKRSRCTNVRYVSRAYGYPRMHH